MTTAGKTEVSASSARIFELLIDSFPDIIYSVTGNGNITYANRQASELLGYSRDELLGMNLRQLYAPEVWDKADAGFAAVKERGALTVSESLIRDKAGQTIPVEIRSLAVCSDTGALVQTLSILRDQRQGKELQGRLLHAHRLAAVGELGACVAHDIANPLAVIKMYVELLGPQLNDLNRLQPQVGSEIQESLVHIERAVEKIEKLLAHLREINRPSESSFTPIDLRRVVADALFMVTSKISQDRVTVVREFPDLPCLVRGNASQLEQVFMNLFSNACDAMHASPQAELGVAIAAPPDGAPCGDWECRVTDNGSGIPPEVIDKMFNLFFTTKPRHEGAGLGLSLARNIVRRHGGGIKVESEVGKGSTFNVRLPRIAPAVAASP